MQWYTLDRVIDLTDETSIERKIIETVNFMSIFLNMYNNCRRMVKLIKLLVEDQRQ